jgi:ketosteroid isomerase-like protein
MTNEHTSDSDKSPTSVDVEAWLSAYGAAWQRKAPDAAAAIFADDARYYETPYAEPFRGPAGVRDYWSNVTADQRDIEFAADLIGVIGPTAVARWSAKFVLISNGANVELNGIFLLKFDADKRCSELREWWHAR